MVILIFYLGISLDSLLHLVYYFHSDDLLGKIMTFCSFILLFNALNLSIRMRLEHFSVPYSKLNINILRKLLILGYVNSFVLKKNSSIIIISILYRSSFFFPIQGLTLMSSPSTKNSFLNIKKLKRLNFSSGVLLVSTKYGILTKSEAIQNSVGGIPLFSVW